MQSFDIVKKSDIAESYRVSRIMADFDVKAEHSAERFTGEIELPEKWNIGVIVGASGTGKTTIARELFGLTEKKDFTAKSVIDDMPKGVPIDEIEKMFYSVGFGSVPSWLKPYGVLSNGEKMRVELAEMLLRERLIVFDEFTSVVDRNVAKVCSLAVQKAIRKNDKQFIAVTCHFDVIPWLKPDWVFNTDTMQMDFQNARDPKNNSRSKSAGGKNGKSLGVITI